MQIYEKLEKCLKSVREKTDFVPKVALILGSGLGDYADGIEAVATISRVSPSPLWPATRAALYSAM